MVRLYAAVPGLPPGPHCLLCHCVIFKVNYHQDSDYDHHHQDFDDDDDHHHQYDDDDDDDFAGVL